MSEVKIPLARPVIGQREHELVTQVLDSGMLSLGPMGADFERKFATYVGAPYAAAVSSGTAALHLSLLVLGIGSGDEVITTPLSFVASANSILFTGAKPVFVDIDSDSLNIDAGAIGAAISESTKAILPVHMFGYPADMDAIESVAGEYGLAVVEDACEALGAVHSKGIKVGARGNPACFGFYPNKQMTTGEGGMVTCGDDSFIEVAKSLRNQGRSSDMAKVEHERLGYNYRLDDISAAVGVAQLERIDEMLQRRSEVAQWYLERLSAIKELTLPVADSGGSRRSWFVFTVSLPKGIDRGGVIAGLWKRGIQSKAYMPAIHLLPFYRERFGYREGMFPVTEEACQRLLALPFFPQMEEGQVDEVCAALERMVTR